MQPTFETNPFRATDLDTVGVNAKVGVDFAPILHRWERYRLWYNGVLIVYTLLWTVIITPALLLDSLFWFQLVLLGGLCNLCFFTGPALEGYGRYFGMWSRFLSLLLFLTGLSFTGLCDTAFLIVRAK